MIMHPVGLYTPNSKEPPTAGCPLTQDPSIYPAPSTFNSFNACYFRPTQYNSSRCQFCIQRSHLPPPVPENLQPEALHLHRTRPYIQPSPLSTPSMAVTPDHPSRVLQGASSSFRDGMFAPLLTVLEEIKETQRVHGRMIQSLLTQQDARAVAALPEDIVFPLRTVSDVTAMEQKLSDPTFQKQVVCSNMTNLAGSQVLMLMFFHIQYCAKVFSHHQLCC